MRVMVDMSATILHHGHIRLLKKAKELGDVIVALSLDSEIKLFKKFEPVLKYDHRKEILESIKYVDEVVSAPMHITDDFLEQYDCELLIHGDDNDNQVSNNKLLIFDRTEGISSTLIKNGITTFKMDKEKKPCSAIYHGLCVSPWGGIDPCCAISGKDFKQLEPDTNLRDYWYNDRYLKEVRKVELSNEWLPECKGCGKKEQKGLRSRKDKMKNWYPYIDEKYTKENPNAVVHFDISFGNTCNQKCIMCNSRYSSNWVEDDKKLSEISEKRLFSTPWNELPLKNWSITYEQLDQIASLVTDQTKKVEIKGGEPLYDKRFQYFVDRVLEKNENVGFSTNTNGTHFSDKNIEMLNNIPNIRIDTSFDGTGKLYEWIRNTSWLESEKNWDRAMKNLKHYMNLNYTTMCYNVDHIQQMYEWAVKKSQKFGRGIFCSFTQVVTTPKPMAPEFASKEKLKQALKQIEYVIEDPENIQPVQHGVSTKTVFQERLQSLYEYINIVYKQKFDKRHYQKHNIMHSTLAVIRGWDIYD